jgi:hypothetical protein
VSAATGEEKAMSKKHRVDIAKRLTVAGKVKRNIPITTANKNHSPEISFGAGDTVYLRKLTTPLGSN